MPVEVTGTEDNRVGEDEQRYDNVEIRSVADGSVISGHEAVKAHLEQEQKLHEQYGPAIFFQVYRINPAGSVLDEFLGEMLVEAKVAGTFVRGHHTVAAVKKRLRRLLAGRTGLLGLRKSEPLIDVADAESMLLVFAGRPMVDKRLFYADHYVMLPAWVQVWLHTCPFEELAERLRMLSTDSQRTLAEGDE